MLHLFMFEIPFNELTTRVATECSLILRKDDLVNRITCILHITGIATKYTKYNTLQESPIQEKNCP